MNLKELLTDEERRILATNLSLLENKVGPELRSTLTVVNSMVLELGETPKAALELCIMAVQESLHAFARFGMAPSGTVQVDEKLMKAQCECMGQE